jgi:hypothetical protein
MMQRMALPSQAASLTLPTGGTTRQRANERSVLQVNAMTSGNSKARQHRTNEDLQRASLAVQYELVTMATTHELLQELGAHWESSTRDKTLSNALLHAFLLAARSLLTFHYAYNPRPSDIIAEDFFDDPDNWRKRRLVPEAAMANGELLGQISKRLAHLTWNRATPTKLLWGPFRIAWNVGLVMQSFLQLVAQDKVHCQLREDVAVIMMRLEALAGPWGGIAAAMAPATETAQFDDLEYFESDDDLAELL